MMMMMMMMMMMIAINNKKHHTYCKSINNVAGVERRVFYCSLSRYPYYYYSLFILYYGSLATTLTLKLTY